MSRLARTVGLLVVAPLLALAPATAAVADDSLAGTMKVGGLVNASFRCDPNTDSVTDEVDLVADGVRRTASVDQTVVVTSNDDASDVSTLTGGMTASVKVAGDDGRLTSIRFDVAADNSLDATSGTSSDCSASIGQLMETEPTLTIGSPRWVTLEATMSRGATFYFAVIGNDGRFVRAFSYGAGSGTARSGFLLPAGAYRTQVFSRSGSVNAYDANSPTETHTRAALKVTFDVPGAALSPAKGGVQHLAMPDERRCSRLGEVVVRVRGGEPVASLVYKVNGRKLGRIKNPALGAKVPLTGMRADRRANVKVLIRFVDGGGAIITRPYLPCE